MSAFILFSFLISLIGLTIASYTDLKERIVSNKLSYAMIVLGLGIHGIQSILEGNAVYIINSVALGFFSFAGAYALYRLGVWAGGDVKLFAGLGTLNPLNPNVLFLVLPIELFQSISLPLFPLTLFIFSVFSMLPYGIIISISGLNKKKELKKELFKETKVKIKQFVFLSLFVTGASFALIYFKLNLLALIPLLIVYSFVKKNARLVLASGFFVFYL